MTQLNFERLADWQGWIMTGPDSTSALTGAGLPVPDGPLSALQADAAIVARTGRDEFMVFMPSGGSAPVGEWCFQRHDMIFRLSGADWLAVMAQLCQFDFRQMHPGDWQMLAVAGINCWLYAPADRPDTLLLGCDPGFSAYLAHTFEAVINDVGQTSVDRGDV